MRTKMVIVWSACGFMLLAGRALWAAPVDLGKPFQVDKDTIALYHLDDVASGEVKDAVEGGPSGKPLDVTQAEGKFGKAISADGTKGWVDFADLPKTKGLTALTAECWVKFRDRPVADLVCRPKQFMIRVSGNVNAYFWIDDNWRIVRGDKTVPVGRWTHLAITWDQATKMASLYVDGQLDVAQEPEGITDAKLGSGTSNMRLGGHTWQANPIVLNGQLDEVAFRRWPGSTSRPWHKRSRERPAGGLFPPKTARPRPSGRSCPGRQTSIQPTRQNRKCKRSPSGNRNTR